MCTNSINKRGYTKSMAPPIVLEVFDFFFDTLGGLFNIENRQSGTLRTNKRCLNINSLSLKIAIPRPGTAQTVKDRLVPSQKRDREPTGHVTPPPFFLHLIYWRDTSSGGCKNVNNPDCSYSTLCNFSSSTLLLVPPMRSGPSELKSLAGKP